MDLCSLWWSLFTSLFETVQWRINSLMRIIQAGGGEPNVHVNIRTLPKSCVTDMWSFREQVCHRYRSREETASLSWNPVLVASLTAAASERSILVTWKRVTGGAVYRNQVFRAPTWKTRVRATQRIPNINILRADPQIWVGFPFCDSFPRCIRLGHIKSDIKTHAGRMPLGMTPSIMDGWT